MPYFEKSDGGPERAGKIAGEILADLVFLSVFALLLTVGLH